MIIQKGSKIIADVNTIDELFDLVISLKLISVRPKKYSKKIKSAVKLFLKSSEMVRISGLHNFIKSVFEFKHSSTVDYWLERGYTELQSRKIVKEKTSNAAKKLHSGRTKDESIAMAKKANNGKQKYIKKMKLENPDELKSQFSTNKEYYIKRGQTEEEAIQSVKNRQSTFSKNSLIQQHGLSKAEDILAKRNAKWMDSIDKKYDWDELSSKKGRTKQQLVDKFGQEQADKIIYDRVKNSGGFKNASKESLLVFEPLILWLEESLKIFFMDLNLGVDNSNEFNIRNTDNGQFMYSYDFRIKSLNIIIEFNGEAWHPNPSWTDDEWINWKQPHNNNAATSKRLFDLKKLEHVQALGYKVLEIWSSKSPKENLEICKEFIKAHI